MSHPPRGAGVSARAILSPIHLAGISALALAAALPVPAIAQQLTEAQTTILERFVLTATRSTKNVLDVPQNVAVIDAKTLEKHQVRDIQDLVRYEPGISVDRQTSLTNPFGQLNSFSIRGVGGNRVQILVDGSRVQERITDGSRDLIDPWNMKAVELVRGPNSVLWGADALGGTVAFRTRDPSDLLAGSGKPWALELKTGWDSFDNSFRKQITAAYDFGDVEVLGSIGHVSSEEPRMTKADPEGGVWGSCPRPSYFRCDQLFPTDTSAWNGLAKVVWTPSADHEFKLTGEFYSRETEIDQIWDSGAENPLYASNPAYYSYYYESQSYIRNLDMSRTRLALEHTWQVNTPWLDSVNWKLSYSPQHRNVDSHQTRYYSLLATPALREIEQVRNYGENFLEADVQLTSHADFAGMSHNFTYGFDGDTTATTYEGYDITNGVKAGGKGFNFPKVDTVRADLYLQDEIKLLDDRLTVTPGVRWATYSIDPTADADYVPLPGYEPHKIESERLIKKLSALYKLDDTYSVYAAYGEGFKMPTSQQLFISSSSVIGTTGFVTVIPNPDLKPESVSNYEAGLRGEFDRGFFSVNGFYSQYENFIRGLQPVAGETNKYTSDNVDRVELWGIEASAEYEVLDNVFLTGSLTYSKGVQQVNSGSDETPFDGAVPLTVVAGVRYELPEHGLELELIGTFADGVTERADPDAFKPEGYAVFDAYAKWSPKENIELTAGIQNIFDTKYFPNTLTGYAATPDDASVAAQNPLELQAAPGRTFKLGATVKF